MEALQETRTKINGKFLPQYNGKPITILGQVLKVSQSKTTFEMKTTDSQVVTVMISEPLQETLAGWVEVRGTGQGKCNVICQHLLRLPMENTAKFDAETFNDLITVINTCNNPWVNSDAN